MGNLQMSPARMHRCATLLIAFVSIVLAVLSDNSPSEFSDDDLAPSNSPDLDDVEHLFPGAVRFPKRKRPWRSSCAGTLIGERLVLTAAHCHVAEGISAHVWGGHSWESYKVDRVIQHDKYIQNGSHTTFSRYDIALVYLTEDVDNAKPLHLNDDEDFPHGHNLYQVWVTGNYNETEVSIRPFAIDARGISSEECMKKVRKSGLSEPGVSLIESVVDDVICLVSSTRNKPCSGHSGGGLLAEGDDDSWIVLGVLSNHLHRPEERCQIPGLPFFDTNVAKFKEWIKENAGDKVEFETPKATEKSPEPNSHPFVLRDIQ